MTGVNSAIRTPTAMISLSNTLLMGMVIGLVIFESITPIKNAEGNKNVNFWGQISNFLALFFQMCVKICQAAIKQEIFITIENV